MFINRRIAALLAVMVTLLPLLAACGGGGGGATPGAAGTKAPGAPGATATAPIVKPTSAAVTPVSTAAVTGTPSVPVTGTQTPAPVATTTAAPGATTTTGPTGMATSTTAPSGTAVSLTNIPTSKNTAPAVPNAAEAKKYSGQTITYYGDSVGPGHDFDMAAAKQFEKQTGIHVKVIPHPKEADQTYAQYLRLFQAKSPDADVLIIDVIWPGSFAPYLEDLKPALGDSAKTMYPNIIKNDTVDGRLVAMPWFADFGLLYYRKDLLQKYGISGPPQTWDQLEQDAKKVMQGERKSNPNFYGFVFQGNAYEGLTCDALEWLASTGGGTFVNQQGKVTINNPQAAQMLKKVQGWVGTIAPRGVTSYTETESMDAFQGGNALFLRNWPYAWGVANAPGSKIKGKVGVAPLPAASGQQHVATVGGQELAVSRYSQHKQAAIEFVKYLTSPQVEAWRAVAGSYAPTIVAVANNPQVQKAMPVLKVQAVRVTRPAGILGKNYNQGSAAIYQGVNQIENGSDPKSVLPQVQQQLQSLLKK